MNLTLSITHHHVAPELVAVLENYGALIMSKIEDVQAVADQALTAVRAANTKADAVIATLISVRDELAILSQGEPTAAAQNEAAIG